ncbi:MAG: tRNA glutamyl-Q(34) synthetase GluQRS, partial [Gammaproteobacteria bacterium]
MNAPAARYRGRFAPSPTGPLHFGSLVAAVASYLRARSQQGDWLVRMEDIDPPREPPGAAAGILRSLETFGLEWDGQVLYQSTRLDAYRHHIRDLTERGLAFPCSCSRRDIEEVLGERKPGQSAVYPGLCRDGPRRPDADCAIRLRVPDRSVGFEDLLQGRFEQHLRRQVGDFVLQRKDGMTAYQLAVVLDDAQQGITEVCRGTDLLDNTPRQIFLQQTLGLPTPHYLHFPLVLASAGEKLSKQTGAPALDAARASDIMTEVLRFLGLPPDDALRGAPPAEQLAWATSRWDIEM